MSSILTTSFVNITYALAGEDEQELRALISQLSRQDVNHVLLRAAMLTDKVELFRIILDAEADLNFQDNEGRTPLFMAVKYSRIPMIQLLIDRGADVNLGKFNQSTALHLAAKKGNIEVIELLVQAGHQLDALNWGGNTALLIGCRFSHADAVTTLISHGASVNICNKLGHYPLHYAAFAGNAVLVGILMNRGADANVRTHLGINPIMLACERKHCAVVATLASQCDLHYREQLYGGTVLHWAIASGCCHCVDCLLNHGASLSLSDSTGRTPVLEAVQSQRPSILQYLLDKHHTDDFGLTSINARILHVAAFLGQDVCVDMLCEHQNTQHLLNIRDSFGDTPLDLALKVGHKKTIKVLLKHGANINHIISLSISDKSPEGSNVSSSNASLNSEVAQEPEFKLSTPELSDVLEVAQDAKEKLSDLCLESTRILRTQSHHKVFKTYSAIKMAMIDMLRSASSQQMVAPVRFDFNTWLDNGPEAFVLKVTSLDLTNWIHKRMHTPWALRELCRGCIRQHLGYRASDKVQILPVPKTIQEFLNMKELDEIETSDIQIRSTGAFDDIDIE